MSEDKKYTSQQKHLRTKYVRFPLDLKPEVLDAFKAKCDIMGTTPTTEIKKFINRRPIRLPFLCLFWGMERAARRWPLCTSSTFH